jgi:hypothetical protein
VKLLFAIFDQEGLSGGVYVRVKGCLLVGGLRGNAPVVEARGRVRVRWVPVHVKENKRGFTRAAVSACVLW